MVRAKAHNELRVWTDTNRLPFSPVPTSLYAHFFNPLNALICVDFICAFMRSSHKLQKKPVRAINMSSSLSICVTPFRLLGSVSFFGLLLAEVLHYR